VLLAPERLSAAGIGPDEERFTDAVERVNPALLSREVLGTSREEQPAGVVGTNALSRPSKGSSLGKTRSAARRSRA
jgi:hypothetical protein